MSSLSALELDPGFTHNLRGMGLGGPDLFSLSPRKARARKPLDRKGARATCLLLVPVTEAMIFSTRTGRPFFSIRIRHLSLLGL